MAQTYIDNFNRADAASLGTASGGWAWTEGAAKFAIASNQASGGTSLPTATTPSLDTQNMYAEYKYISQGASGIANLLFNWTDNNNTHRFFVTPIFPLRRLTAISGGSETTLASDFSATSANDVFRCTGSGTVGTSYDILVQVNGGTLFNITGNTVNVGSGKKVKIEEGNNSTWVLDDFTAADVGGVAFIAGKPVIIKQAVNRASTY